MDAKKEIDAISKWTKEYVQNARAKRIIVGLSGGIDSSVIACLAVQAVGKENVIGISLPCQTRDDMKSDARKLANNLGIHFETIEIRKAVGNTAEGVRMAGFEVTPLVLANIKARERMNNLYAVAGATNGLVAGTGNLSELMVGYFTKYGDGGVDIEPIGNYYKTEVYEMAELMPEIPNSVKTKAPTADLWEGQTDEDELGMSYAELDEILKVLNNPNSSKLDTFDIDKITQVERMIFSSVHKNNTPPRYVRETFF
jgi:NAD+ synthase